MRAEAHSDQDQQVSQIIIDVGQQMDGMTFRLSPRSRIALSARLRSQSLPSSVFVSYDTRLDLNSPRKPIWQHIVSMLTGLSEKQIATLGGFRFVLRPDDEIVFESKAPH